MVAPVTGDTSSNWSHTRARVGTTLRLTFPGRRYHATPWGNHVNEGLIEWPPSPWRILRALLATGYSKLCWPAEGPPEIAVNLIRKLSTTLPIYRLPNAVGAHSRHYMPFPQFNKEPALVLDTWAQVDGEWLGVHWPVELDESEREMLGKLAYQMGYLGRSESWVEGELVEDEVSLEEFAVAPDEARPGSSWEQISLLAPESAESYASWREERLTDELSKLPKENARGKPLTKAQSAKQAETLAVAYPKDLIGCLQADTRFLHEGGWSQPPGTRKVLYWRPMDVLRSAPSRTRAPRVEASPVEFVLLAMAAEHNNMGSLPSVVRTLPQGELLHRALLSRFTDGDVPAVLSGRDSTGSPLRGTSIHQHIHILHLDLDGDEHLDHVLLWAPAGLGGESLQAVRATRHEVAKNAKRPHRLAVAASGQRAELLGLRSGANPQLADRLQRVLGGVKGTQEWISLTPFVPPRYLKSSGKNSLEGQLCAELHTRGLPEPEKIEIVRLDSGTGSEKELARKARHFIRRRARVGMQPPIDCGFVVKLEFSCEVQGPLLLGYGCHFGLGAFEAV